MTAGGRIINKDFICGVITENNFMSFIVWPLMTGAGFFIGGPFVDIIDCNNIFLNILQINIFMGHVTNNLCLT